MKDVKAINEVIIKADGTKSLKPVTSDGTWEDIERGLSDIRMVKAEFFKSNIGGTFPFKFILTMYTYFG